MKKLRVLLMSAILSVLAIGMNSCGEINYGSVVGTWELQSDEYGYVDDYSVDKYHFYADGTGVYGYYDYDRYGAYWVGDVPFRWGYGWDGPNSIWMEFYDGSVYRYYFDVYGSRLKLSQDRRFRSWLLYSRSYR